MGLGLTLPIIPFLSINNQSTNIKTTINEKATQLNPMLLSTRKYDLSNNNLSNVDLNDITLEDVIDIIYDVRLIIFSDLPKTFEKKHISIASYKVDLLNKQLIISDIILSQYVDNSNTIINGYKSFGNFTFSGFSEIPIHPDGFDVNQLNRIAWLNYENKDVYPFDLVNTMISSNSLDTQYNELIQDIKSAATNALMYKNNAQITKSTTTSITLYNQTKENVNTFLETGEYPTLNNAYNDLSNGQLQFNVLFSNVLINGIVQSININVRLFNANTISFNVTGNNDDITNINANQINSSFSSRYPTSISVSELKNNIENWLNKDRESYLNAEIEILDKPTYLETSIKLTYKMTNYISSKPTAPVITNWSGPYTLTINNFIKENTPNYISTTPNNSLNIPIQISNQWVNTYASDLTSSQVLSFLNSDLITKLFDNLPSDYASNDSEPKIVSYQANDNTGELTVSFCLTYFILNNKLVEGESEMYKLVLTGFKQQVGFRHFARQYSMPTYHMYNINYINFIKQKLLDYINTTDYFSNNTIKKLNVFINQNLKNQTTSIVSVPSISSKQDNVIYIIPEISNITGDTTWSNGYSITLNDLQYHFNNVIAINQTLSTTFDSFKQDPTIFSINDLISITNPLPPVEVGSSQLVTPTFRPGLGNNQTGQGQIIFNFPKFYHPTGGLIENYEITFNYKFQTENVSINPDIESPFYSSIDVKVINDQWGSLSYDQIIWYLKNENNKTEINQILNSTNVKQQLVKNNELLTSNIKFHNASIGGDQKLYIVLSIDSNIASFSVELINMLPIMNETIFINKTPPSNINSSNIYEYLEQSPTSELDNRCREFLDILYLPEYSTVKNIDVYSVIKDSNNYTTIYINYVFSYVYATINNKLDVIPNYLVQQRLYGVESGSTFKILSSEIIVNPNNQEFFNSYPNYELMLIILPIFIFITIILITIIRHLRLQKLIQNK